MAGSSTDVDRGYTKSSTINLVVFGKTGKGKSAVGNGILGRNEFLLIPSMFGLTSNSGLQSTKLKDGRLLNVIDVFGLFGSDEIKPTVKEIVRCLSLAKDGIHAIFMFFSDRSRITPDEAAVIEYLKTFFGDKILNYMIVVLPGEGVPKSYRVSRSKFLRDKIHPSLKKFIQSSNGWVVVLDKKTCDAKKQAEQLGSLMGLVDIVVANNFLNPFSDDIFGELKEIALLLEDIETKVEFMEGFSEHQISALNQEIYQLYQISENIETETALSLEHIETEVQSMEGFSEHKISALKQEIYQLYRISENLEMIAQKFKQLVERFEKLLVEGRAARLVAEKISVEAMKFDEDRDAEATSE